MRFEDVAFVEYERIARMNFSPTSARKCCDAFLSANVWEALQHKSSIRSVSPSAPVVGSRSNDTEAGSLCTYDQHDASRNTPLLYIRVSSLNKMCSKVQYLRPGRLLEHCIQLPTDPACLLCHWHFTWHMTRVINNSMLDGGTTLYILQYHLIRLIIQKNVQSIANDLIHTQKMQWYKLKHMTNAIQYLTISSSDTYLKFKLKYSRHGGAQSWSDGLQLDSRQTLYLAQNFRTSDWLQRAARYKAEHGRSWRYHIGSVKVR